MRHVALCLTIAMCVLWLVGLVGCRDSDEVGRQRASHHVQDLVQTIQVDVQEVRAGLPQGAKHLAALFEKEEYREEKAAAAREAVQKARNKVQDLRVAKSTFFAVAGADGVVIRNDQEQDRMAGKSLFGPFPRLREALRGKYVETLGSMPEASGVKGKPDAQWVAAHPVSLGGVVKGLYVTGWSWSAYAYRLEFSLRGKLRSALAEHEKLPLIYVFVVVDRNVYGAPVSPVVSQEAIARLDPMSKIQGDGTFSTTIEITGRSYALAVKGTPIFGPKVGVAVLWSET
jgi:hypothetical protein